MDMKKGLFGSAAATLLVGYYLRRRNEPPPPQPFPWITPKPGFAARLTVDWCYRKPDPFGGGTKTLRCTDTREEIKFADMIQSASVMTYCVDIKRQLVLFLETRQEYKGEPVHVITHPPFLDRGIRLLAGAHAYVASLATISAYLEAHPFPKDAKFCWVWNTGRCGSTLMHRLLQRSGVCSLSEPYWFEQLSFLPREQRQLTEFKQALKDLHLLDWHIARSVFPDAKVFSLNPKGFGHLLRKEVMELFPEALHMFIYRDCLKVVESFSSIFYSRQSQTLAGVFRHWLFSRGYCRHLHPQKHPELKRVAAIQPPVITSSFVEARAFSWLGAIYSWLDDCKSIVSSRSLVLRMDEFVGKSTRAGAVNTILAWLGVQNQNSQDLMRVFNKDSQQGHNMGTSSSAKTGRVFLSERDRLQIQTLLNKTDLRVTNPILPGSILAD